jgi:carbon storage regulator
MLVLTRKVNEAIVIAGKIRVVVSAVKGERVRLGVGAPSDVTIDREEIHLRRASAPRGPPDVFTQEEYNVLSDHTGCEPEMFYGRQMYVREGPKLHVD